MCYTEIWKEWRKLVNSCEYEVCLQQAVADKTGHFFYKVLKEDTDDMCNHPMF